MICYCCQSTKGTVATGLWIARVQERYDLLIFLVKFGIF